MKYLFEFVHTFLQVYFNERILFNFRWFCLVVVCECKTVFGRESNEANLIKTEALRCDLRNRSKISEDFNQIMNKIKNYNSYKESL